MFIGEMHDIWWISKLSAQLKDILYYCFLTDNDIKADWEELMICSWIALLMVLNQCSMCILCHSFCQDVFLKLVSDAPIYREEMQHAVDGNLLQNERRIITHTAVISLYVPQGFIGTVLFYSLLFWLFPFVCLHLLLHCCPLFFSLLLWLLSCVSPVFLLTSTNGTAIG